MRRLVALLCLFAWPAFAQEEGISTVNVLADPPLTLALREIARDYARKTQGSVTLSFSGTTEKNNLIAEGAAVDVVVTANAPWLTQLRQQGVVDIHSEMNVAGNRLALVSPSEEDATLDFAQELASGVFVPRMSYPVVAAGSPETTAEGIYVRGALRKLDKNGDLELYALYVKERSRLYEMLRDGKAYGILLTSDAKARNLHVLSLLPEDSHPAIAYHGVVLAGENMVEARKFLLYLQTPSAQETLRRQGFTPVR